MKTIAHFTAAILFAAGVAGCTEAVEVAPRQDSSAVKVVAEALVFERVGTRIEAVGTSRAQLSSELYAASSGEVVTVSFAPGQQVEAGQVLVELDSREQRLARRQAQLELDEARRLYDRYRRSASSGAVAATVLDAARTEFEKAQVELGRAEIALEQRTVRAVFSGHVGTTEVDPGDRIGTDTLITTLDDRSSLLVRFDVPEAYIGELAVGDSLSLRPWASTANGLTGEIVDIGSRIDPRNRTFSARARVDNKDDSLRPGMSFRVEIEVEGELHASVTETGVQWGADGAYVWSIDAGVAQRIPVEIVQRRAGRVLVRGNLARGDAVVVEGTQRMRDGIAVEVDSPRLARQGGGAGGGADSAALD